MLSTLLDGHWRARTAAGIRRLIWVFLTLGLLGMIAVSHDRACRF